MLQLFKNLFTWFAPKKELFRVTFSANYENVETNQDGQPETRITDLTDTYTIEATSDKEAEKAVKKMFSAANDLTIIRTIKA